MTLKRFAGAILGATALLYGGALLGTDYELKSVGGGFQLNGDRLELSIHSQFIVVTPEWMQRYYSVTGPADYLTAADQQSAQVVQTGRDDEFKLLNYSAAVRDDAVIYTLDAELLKNVPASIEYTMFMPPVVLLSGAEFTAELENGQTISGVIPEEYTQTQVHYYFRNAKSAVFKTKFGTLSLKVLAGMPFNLGDRRFNQFENRYGYWFGYQVDMQANQPIHNQLEVKFVKAADVVLPQTVAVDNTKIIPVADDDNAVVMPEKTKRRLLPTPQQYTPQDGVYALTADSAVSISAPNHELDRLATAADRVLRKQSGMPLYVDNSSAQADVQVVVGDKFGNLTAPENPEGYTLQVTRQGVRIVSRTPRGCFYGLQTLRNLYNPENNSFDQCTIVDYPDMEYRGAMFLVDDYSIVAHKYMIENMLAPLKMNEIIMECEYAKWDATKDIHQPHGISKSDIAELIKIANDNYIDVSPLFQTLGHCEWLFQDGKNLDMAEDPAYPYAYNVSHPDLYPLMDSILDEIVETFNNPKYLHIGHDEVFFFLEAKFPNRPENIAKGAKKIIFDDVMHYYDYAKERNMRLMMWHDMFATREECPENGFGGKPHFVAELRPQLPKDIVIADWRYSGGFTEYKDVETFRNEGFDVIGCTWYDPGNIENLSKAVKKHGGMGMFQTIWNGYFGNKQVLQDGFNQIAPYVRTACWSWHTADAANTYDSHEVAAGFYEKMKEIKPAAGKMLDLDNAANLEITAANNPFLYMDTYGIDSVLKPGNTRIGQVEFMLPGKDGKLYAAAVKSNILPDAPPQIDLSVKPFKADKLFLLHTIISAPAKRLDPVANLRITYADGSTTESPIAYYRDIAPLNEPFNHNLSPINSVDIAGNHIWYMTWQNPFPEREIAKISIDSLNYAYYLFAITAAE